MSNYTTTSDSSSSYAISWNTPFTTTYDLSDGETGVKSTLKVKKDGDGKIGVKLFFTYVKHKLTKIQQNNLDARLKKLSLMVKEADDLGQIALYDNLAQSLAVLIRESELSACGVDTYIQLDVVKKYLNKTRDDAVKLTSMEDFPRLMPKAVVRKYKAVADKKLFDEYWILFTDYSGEKLKSNKEKIREKDPILFGKFAYQPDRLYFIADWIDEYCDLNLSEFINRYSELEDTMCSPVKKTNEVTPEFFKRIKEEVKQKHERLHETNSRNFRDKMREEDDKNVVKKSFWQRISRQ